MTNEDKIIMDRILTSLASDISGMVKQIYNENKDILSKNGIETLEEFDNWISTVSLDITYK
jgi:hypothetical protein